MTILPRYIKDSITQIYNAIPIKLPIAFFTELEQKFSQSVSIQFSCSVTSDSMRAHELQHARPPWSITNSWSPPKPMSIELVMPSNHLILCCPLLLLSIFPSIRVFSNEMHSLHQVAKVLEFQLQHDSFQCTPGLISLGRNG